PYARLPKLLLRPRSRKANQLVRSLHGILEGPESSLHRLVKRFIVGHRGLQLRVPVHQPLAAEDVAILEHLEEGHAHRSGTHLVEGETRARPVAGAAKLLELVADT